MVYRNIPIFIPHMGCPHRCAFCNQTTISGTSSFDLHAVRDMIEQTLSTMDSHAPIVKQIAYFGGSFTAIPMRLMYALLDLAQEYVEAGLVDGIRFSTRPDKVSDELLDSLRPYRISAIELGLQSLDDRVLSAVQRGHTAAVARDACRRIVARGYTLGGQMMLGLPQSSASIERETAEQICALGATEARIYPTVVLRDTALCTQMESGAYTPLTCEQAVARAADVLDIFDRAGVRCLRIGLCENEELRSDQVVGGAHHPALGEWVLAEQYYRRMADLLSHAAKKRQGETALFWVAPGKISQAIGQKRNNIHRLCRCYGLRQVRVREHAALTEKQVLLDGEGLASLPSGQSRGGLSCI